MTTTTSQYPLSGKRILIAKPGLDGHDTGAKIIALAMRDAGAEVIYTGLRKSPGYISRVAVEEDVDAIGLSLLSGSHRELVQQVMEQLRKDNIGSIPVVVGGTIPAGDHQYLLDLGVKGIYTSEMELTRVIDSLAQLLQQTGETS